MQVTRSKFDGLNFVSEMVRIKFNITDELMKEISAEADRLWPKQGMIAVARLARDSLRRFWRYCNGKSRTGYRDRPRLK